LQTLHVLQLGRISYAEALAVQQRAVALRREGSIGDLLLFVEHNPVITLGRNAHRENILVNEAALAQQGIELHETNRGGDVTYHGPGQLVGYPILDLRGEFPQKRGPYLGPVDYVRLLEEVLMRSCGEFGVTTQRIAGCTGVWTLAAPEKKLAAIGVHVTVGITSHGFALNVLNSANNAHGFDCIIPCGIATRGITSLQAEIESKPPCDQQPVPTLQQVEHSVARHFSRVFARDLHWAESLDEAMTVNTVSG